MATTNSSCGDPSDMGVILRLMQRLLSPHLHMRRNLAAGFALEATGMALGVCSPLFLKQLIDVVSQSAPMGGYLILLILAYALSAVGGGLATGGTSRFTSRLVDTLTRDLTHDALASIMPGLAVSGQPQSQTVPGDLERLTFSLQIVIDGLLWRLVPALIMTLTCLVVLARYLPFAYLLILILVLVTYGLVAILCAGLQQARAIGANQALSNLSACLNNITRNASRVVFNGALSFELRNLDIQLAHKRRANEAFFSVLWLSVTLQNGVAALGLFSLLGVGAMDLMAGRTHLGTFILLQAYIWRLIAPLSGMGALLAQVAPALVNIRDVLKLCKGAGADRPAITEIQGPASLALTDLCFSFGDSQVIHNLDAVFTAGQVTAIVGPNGSGKSTLAKLIAGMIEPSRGQVSVDGRDMATIPFAERHLHCLYVPQNVSLLNRSLSNTLLYPPTALNWEDGGRWLAVLNFYADPKDLDPDWMIGEDGKRLSGGQGQKLELARVLGISRPVIILDQSTSALDPGSEIEIIETLKSQSRLKSTLILVTHRRDIAERADQVIFMRAGRIIRHGPHNILMRDSAAYSGFWTSDA